MPANADHVVQERPRSGPVLCGNGDAVSTAVAPPDGSTALTVGSSPPRALTWLAASGQLLRQYAFLQGHQPKGRARVADAQRTWYREGARVVSDELFAASSTSKRLPPNDLLIIG
jgi:hypothetical protein